MNHPTIGLLAVDTNTPLTLVGTDISIRLCRSATQVVVRSEYWNETGKDHRVVSAHPSPPGWTVRGAQVQYQGKEATTTVVTSLSTGGQRPGPTVATVPIPWTMVVGTTLVVTVTYLTPLHPLPQVAPRIAFTLPADFFPPVVRPKGTAVQYNELFKMPLKRLVADGIAVSMSATLDVPLRGSVSLLSGSDAPQPLEATVQYLSDSSFSLLYKNNFDQHPIRQPLTVVAAVQPTEEPLRVHVVSDTSGTVPESSRHAVSLCITPSLSQLAPNAELVFLVDSHDSHSSMAFAHAIYLALHGVPPGTRVNVLYRRSEGDLMLFPGGCRPVEEVDVEQLAATVSGLRPRQPSPGGPFSDAFLAAIGSGDHASCGPIRSGFLRHIVLLTTSVDETAVTRVAAVAVEQVSRVRLHAVGLEYLPGSGGTRLKALALASNGLYQGTSSVEGIPGAVVGLLAAALVPTLTDVKIAFYEEGVRPAFMDRRVPALPQGTQLYLYALAPSTLTEKLSTYVTGKVNETVVEFIGTYDLSTQPEADRVTVNGGLADEQSLVHAAAAVERTHALSEYAGRTATTTEKNEIVELSTTLTFPSPYTQLALVRDGGDPAPLGAPYRGDATPSLVAVDGPRTEPFPLHHRPAPPPPPTLLPAAEVSTMEFVRAIVSDLVETVLAPPSPSRLVPLQRRDGSFPLTTRYAAALGISEAAIQTALPEGLTPESWATALAARYMQSEPLSITALASAAAGRYLSRIDNAAQYSAAAEQFLVLHGRC